VVTAEATRLDRRVTVGDRLRMLRLLRFAGGPVATAVVTIHLVQSAVPALTAWTLAGVVARAAGVPGGGGVVRAVLPPLAGYAAVLMVGHALEAATAPLDYVVKVRIDGARRAALSQLVAHHPTIERIEDPEVRNLIRVARANPQNWTERTPGDGALAVLGMCASVFGLATACAILIRYRWWLIPVVVVPALATRALNSRRHVEYMRQWRRGIGEGMRSGTWSEMLAGAAEGKEVRIFGFADLAVERMRHHLLKMFEPAWALGRRHLREQWWRLVFVGGGLGVTFAAVAQSAAQGHTPIAVETAIFVAAWGAYQSIAGYDVGSVLGAIPGEQAYEMLASLLVTEPTADKPEAAAGPPRPPSVQFDDVTFSYPGAERPVLDKLSIQIRPGELLAIVGMNGAGKSTLIKLLSGLYKPTGGAITADGRDIWELGITRWRRQISVVFQEFARYHLSLADNVVLGQSHPLRDDDNLRTALEQSGLGDVVARLPNGVETLLGRDRGTGVELSGGQWQQVVLARALYAVAAGARVLVLDEPTAHLDVRSEFELFSRVARRRGEASIVLISHRLSTVRQADRIVLIESGRIVEEGSHDELMAIGGRYAAMFTIQAERFVAGLADGDGQRDGESDGAGLGGGDRPEEGVPA